MEAVTNSQPGLARDGQSGGEEPQCPAGLSHWGDCELFLELNQAQAKLADTESRFEALFEGIDDAIIVHDVEGRIFECNRAACRRLGYSRDELLSLTTRDIDDEKFAAGFAERLSRQFEEGVHHCEGIHVTRDGTRIPVDIMTSRIAYRGTWAVLAVIRDISRRKQAQREKEEIQRQMEHAQKLEGLGVLAGGIAHDFNNLLTSVLGRAELAMESIAPGSSAQGDLCEIRKAATHAADLCRQLLAYSGKGQFVVEAVDVNALIREMSGLFEVSKPKRTVLKCSFADEETVIEADASQIRQVIMNLVTNAGEAIGDKNGVISLSTEVKFCTRDYLATAYLDEDLPAGRYIFGEVSDTGCGMDAVTREKIFDPFFSTKFTGRGLGLAAVLGIVRGHGGAIKVYSEPGRGTAFKLILPAVGASSGNAESVEVDNASWKASGTILLADDEEAVRSLGQSLLERRGFDVLVAKDGIEAVEKFKEHRDAIDCILLDLTMPGMSGKEAFQEIQQLDGKAKIVLCSGYNEQEVVNQFAGRTLAGFVQKPYETSHLIDKVQSVIRED